MCEYEAGGGFTEGVLRAVLYSCSAFKSKRSRGLPLFQISCQNDIAHTSRHADLSFFGAESRSLLVRGSRSQVSGQDGGVCDAGALYALHLMSREFKGVDNSVYRSSCS